MKEFVEYPQGQKAEILILEAILGNDKKLYDELQTKLKINFELYDWSVNSISSSLVEYLFDLYEEKIPSDLINEIFPGDNLKCDIMLISKDNKDEKIYIEIKSWYKNEIKFDLTLEEFNFAKEHSENYYIILVSNIQEKEKEKWQVDVLPKKFWENNNYKKKELYQFTKKYFSKKV